MAIEFPQAKRVPYQESLCGMVKVKVWSMG